MTPASSRWSTGRCIAAAIVALAWPLVDFDAVRLPRGRPDADRRRPRRARDPARARSDAPDRRLDSAGDGRRRSSSTATPGRCSIASACRSSPIAATPLDRLVGTLYMTLEGMFGVPLDVAATYIVLFTIYGAVLEHSGAGRVLHRLGDGGDAAGRASRRRRPAARSRSPGFSSARCRAAASPRR